jgi:transposase-like protein
MSGLLAPQFQNEEAARKHLEKTLWPDGPVCPHCGIIGEAFRLQGETNRDGLYKCSACREPFTVTIGTIFEDSHIPLHKWLLAIHLMCSSKKGISAHQLWRNLWGVNPETGKPYGSYRSAWFMAHRIRWALGREPVASKLEGVVEIDEAYIGGKRRYPQPHVKKLGERAKDRLSPFDGKAPVLSILQRDGEVRSMHMPRVTAETLKPVIEAMIDKSAHMMTDSASALRGAPMGYKQSKVNHSAKEYVRHEDGVCVSTNTVEGYFSILKRGNYGIYHHWGQQYTDQYLREFDFRYNIRKLNDDARAMVALKKTKGRRLVLKAPKQMA